MLIESLLIFILSIVAVFGTIAIMFIANFLILMSIKEQIDKKKNKSKQIKSGGVYHVNIMCNCINHIWIDKFCIMGYILLILRCSYDVWINICSKFIWILGCLVYLCRGIYVNVNDTSYFFHGLIKFKI